MTLHSADVDRFRAAVASRLGLQFDEDRDDVLLEVLQDRIRSTGSTAGAYLAELEDQRESAPEIRALAQRLTVGETYFFRNIEQFEALAQVALPSRMQARASERVLRVLSAGCSSGEEPYSLAMVLRPHLAAANGWRAEVTGVDLDGAALGRARRARYSIWSLRETPAEARKRWFRAEGRDFVVSEDIRDSVLLEQRNLAADDAALWIEGRYDVIFFRNVVMYFTTAQAQAIIARIERSLAPGGFLFLGHAETLRGLSSAFSLCHSHGTFYYRRKGGPPMAAGGEVVAERAPEPWPALPRADVTEESADWAESICRAGARIQGLAEIAAGARGARASESRAEMLRRTSEHVASLRDLLRQERFVEALELIGSLPANTRQAPEVLLLNAALLTHSGALAEAEMLCQQILAGDDLNAGAHHLLALCREGAGDLHAAIEHDESAAYLDPGFAMPRLHLALIHRRRGEHARARTGFADAIVLLQREDPARLLLFGGGFQRDALIALCRAEITRCEVRP